MMMWNTFNKEKIDYIAMIIQHHLDLNRSIDDGMDPNSSKFQQMFTKNWSILSSLLICIFSAIDWNSLLKWRIVVSIIEWQNFS